MTRVKNIVLGLDPGGIGNFGWCVADAETNLPINILATGTADHAQAAITAVQKYLACRPTSLNIIAVGIDSPLFWTADGDREADIFVRNAINAKGAKNVYGTVQNINALRGACLVQGILSAGESAARRHPIPVEEGTSIRSKKAPNSGAKRQVFMM